MKGMAKTWHWTPQADITSWHWQGKPELDAQQSTRIVGSEKDGIGILDIQDHLDLNQALIQLTRNLSINCILIS